MKNLLSLVFLLNVLITNSQSTSLSWVKNIGSASSVEGRGIATDASNNVYTTGNFDGTADFDPGIGTYSITSNGGNDIFVSKLDALGNFVWAFSIGGLGGDLGFSITTDATGNVYVTGYYVGVVDFDPSVATFTLPNYGQDNIFVAKYSSSGSLIWAKGMGSTSNEHSTSIDIDNIGNVITTGWFTGTADFDPSASTFTLTSIGGDDIFVSKLDGSGNFVWAKQIGGPGSDRGQGVKVDPSGNIHITGYFSNTTDFDPSATTYTLSSGLASQSAFITKLNSSGNLVWAGSIASNQPSYGNAITLDASANVYATGFYNGTADFDFSAVTNTLVSSGNADIFILKYNSGGIFTWAKSIGGTNADVGKSINVDATYNVYTTGNFSTLSDFDPNAGTYTLATPVGERRVFVSKLDFSGNFVWAGAFTGGSGSGMVPDIGNGITLDAGNNILTTGSYFSTSLDFDPNVGTATLPKIGFQDQFIHKLGQCLAVTATASLLSGPSCNGGNNGSAYVTPSSGGSPFTYTWLPSGGSASLTTGLSAGTVSCVVTNSCGSTTTKTLNVLQPPTPLSTATAVTNVTCNGGSTGAATVTASGGTPGYSYLWSTAATTSVITGQTAGVKTVTITDANGCTSTNTVTITQPASALTTATTVTNVFCNSGSTGSATITASGGTAGYTYLWSTAATTSVITGQTAGVKTVTVTDANGCTNTKSVTITQPSALTITAIPASTVICANAITTITISASGGTMGYSGIGSFTTNVANNSYTVTDANGCSLTTTVNITVNPTPTISVNSGAICTGNSFTIIPNGASTYTIQGGSSVVTPTANASYTLTGTSAAGCIGNTATSNVTVNALPVVTVNSSTLCSGQTNLLIANGATTYSWNTAATTNSIFITPTTNTTYVVTGTDANGCVKSATSTAIVNPNPTVTAVSSSSLLCVGQSATITPSGAVNYSITGNNFTVSPSTTSSYTITGVDANGCTNSTAFTQSVSTCTGFENLELNDLQFTIYPNPSNGEFNITTTQDLDIEVADVLGKIIFNKKINAGNYKFELNETANGIYFIKATQNGQTKTVKLIKE
jgi:hypothetical protein